jgi:hypothetical protein
LEAFITSLTFHRQLIMGNQPSAPAPPPPPPCPFLTGLEELTEQPFDHMSPPIQAAARQLCEAWEAQGRREHSLLEEALLVEQELLAKEIMAVMVAVL